MSQHRFSAAEMRETATWAAANVHGGDATAYYLELTEKMLRQAADDLDAPASAPVRAETWQAMDTAPKDGTVCILFGPHPEFSRDAITFGWFEDEGWRDEWHHLEPTHWMPLPDAPETPDTRADATGVPR